MLTRKLFVFRRWLLKKWKRRKICRKNEGKVADQDVDSITTMQFIQREESKPDLEDFTLGEYTEKVIVYGFLMVRKYGVIYFVRYLYP